MERVAERDGAMPARLRASYTLITQEQSALACHTRRAKAGYRDSHYQGLRTTAACDTETQLKSPQNMRASGTLSNSLPSGITPTRSSTGHQRPHGQRGWKQLSWSLTVAFTVNCAELLLTPEMQRFAGRRRYRHHHQSAFILTCQRRHSEVLTAHKNLPLNGA